MVGKGKAAFHFSGYSAIAAATAHRNSYINLFQGTSPVENRRLFTTTRNDSKGVIEVDNLLIQSIGSRDFWLIYGSFSNKGKTLIPPLFNGPEVISSFRNKAQRFAKLFSRNSILDDSGHILPDFPPRTDTDMTHLSITKKVVADVIATLDLKLPALLKFL